MRVRAQFLALSVLYVVTAAVTIAVLLVAAAHYTPFDRSNLVFLHPRLKNVAELRTMFTIATLCWFASFAALVLWLLAHRIEVTSKRFALLLGAQIFVGVLFASVPIAIDSDQFAYAGYAFAGQHENVYANPSIAADAPAATQAVAQHWGNPLPVDRYGGLWTGANTLMLAPFVQSGIETQALVLRIAALAAFCGMTLVAGLFLIRVSLGSLALIALNPLMLLETANGAHNDIYLALAGAIALVFFMRRRFRLTGILLGCATAIKFAYAPFVAPLLAVVFARTRSIRDVLVVAAGFTSVLALSMAPFGWRHGVVQSALLIAHEHGALAHLAPIAALAAIVALSLLTIEALRLRYSPSLIVILAILFLALTGKIEAWYVMMTAPLGLTSSMIARLAFLALSAFGIVLVQASFGSFPLIEALIAMLAVGTVAASLIVVQRRPRHEPSA